MDNQYVIRAIDQFLNNSLGQEIINLVTLIFIQTSHPQLGQLYYPNIICLPKVADDIDVKKPIPGEIYGDYEMEVTKKTFL